MTIDSENLAIKAQLSELVGDLWEMHQSKLRAMASDTGNKIQFRFAVKIDFSQKTPAGDVEIGFGKPSKRTLSFQVEDVDAPELPISGITHDADGDPNPPKVVAAMEVISGAIRRGKK